MTNYFELKLPSSMGAEWKKPDIGEKAILVIVDEAGRTINKNPSKDELKGLTRYPWTCAHGLDE